MTGGFCAATRFQAQVLRRDPADLMALVTVPLVAAGLLAIITHAGRPGLLSYAVIAPVVIALWQMALQVCGEIVDRERSNGSLELLVAAPSPVASIIFARILCVTAVSLVAVAESWAVAWLGFGFRVEVAHPGWFAAALAATALGIAGAATVMAGVFVLTRTARTFQNSLSYPFYILGGAMVPVGLLPGWLEAISRAFFLSWATDLLRDSLAVQAVEAGWLRLATVLILGAAWYAVAFPLLRAVLRRVRRNAEVTTA